MAENKIITDAYVSAVQVWKRDRRAVPPGCEPAGGEALSVWVEGVPGPQGSKRAFGAGRPGGKIRMVEMSKKVGPWRNAVKAAWLEWTRAQPLGTFVRFHRAPVVVKLVFVMPRPQAQRKATKPMVERPDLDKLIRSTLDAIGMAGVWVDDSQVITVHAHKRRAEIGESTGVMIHIEPVTADPHPDFRVRAVLGAHECDAHGVHPHRGMRCLDCPECVLTTAGPGQEYYRAPDGSVAVRNRVPMIPFSASLPPVSSNDVG
jgi:crossover junction endodeoxyribonuclease RusA